MRQSHLVRGSLTVLAVAGVVALWAAARPAAQVQAQAPGSSPIVGSWTVNKEPGDAQADHPPGDQEGAARGSTRGAGGGRRRGGGGFGGGGFGGGRGRGGGGQGQAARDPEEAARLRDAMRDIMNPPDHLTIVQTETMVIMTGPDGRTTRLSPNGKKIKDDSTKLERKTKWDGGKLVSEIGGLPTGKITQTWSVDPERHQLHITLEGDNQKRLISVARVYDADAK